MGFIVLRSRSDMSSLEKFQKISLRLITGTTDASYLGQLIMLSLLALPKFLQLNDNLLVTKMRLKLSVTNFYRLKMKD